MESDKTQENITYKRAKRSAFSQQVTTTLQDTTRGYYKDKDSTVQLNTGAKEIQQINPVGPQHQTQQSHLK